MGRRIVAVLGGAAVWAVLWIVGSMRAQAVFPDILVPTEPLTHLGALVGYIVYSVVLSVLAGYVTAAIAKRDSMPAVWTLAMLQLALGIFFEALSWSLMPVGYHLVFLALIVPATVLGGKLKT